VQAQSTARQKEVRTRSGGRVVLELVVDVLQVHEVAFQPLRAPPTFTQDEPSDTDTHRTRESASEQIDRRPSRGGRGRSRERFD
jgi:hypothetical protein